MSVRHLTTDRKIAYAVTAAALAVSLAVLLIPKNYLVWSAAAIFSLVALGTFVFMKKRSIHSFNKRQVLIITSVIALLYLTLFYMSGIKYGFYRSPNTGTTIESAVLRILPLLLICAATEWVRTVMLAEGSRLVTLMSYAFGVASVVVCAGGIPSFNSSVTFSDYLGVTLFPALTANLLYTHCAKRYGILPGLSYRLILLIYSYLIPILPNAPRIIESFALAVLPVIAMAFISLLFDKRQLRARKSPSRLRFVMPILTGGFMVTLVMLISCQFRFGMLVIATESMTGELNVGDAVVYEQYEHHGEIQENDVIIFEEGNRQVVHRVVRIDTVNGQRQYITKGDANDGVDYGYRTDESIVGVVKFKIIYIGYPSLWLREIFRK